MKKTIKTSILAAAALMLTACSTSENVGDFVNKGCGIKPSALTKSNANLPVSVLRMTRVGSDLQCEVRNCMIGCSDDATEVKCDQTDQSISIHVIPRSSHDVVANCICWANLYFTIFDGALDEFDLTYREEFLGHVAFGNENTVAYNFDTEEFAYGDDAFAARLEVRDFQVSKDSTLLLSPDSIAASGITKKLRMSIDRKMSMAYGHLENYWVPSDAKQISIQAHLDDEGALVIVPAHDGTDTALFYPVSINFILHNLTTDYYHLKLNPHKVIGEDGQEKTVFDYEGDILFETKNSDHVEIEL